MIFILLTIYHAGWQDQIHVDWRPFESVAECEAELPVPKAGVTAMCVTIRNRELWEWTPACAVARFREVYPVCRG